MTNSYRQSEFCFVEQGKFPSTRYQGSKQKFIDWIWFCIKDLQFQTCLDAFGGTGCFAYRAKQELKSVTYNDILPFNAIIGKTLIENQGTTLTEDDVNEILDLKRANDAPHFIEETFCGIYYTDEENRWLDKVSYNIRNLKDQFKQSMAYFALFQSCIIKRPYNLFHRRNLYVRMQDVKRSFGNKTTWDTPFETHFKKFVKEINLASFDSKITCHSTCQDAMSIDNKYDLVYIDTPYIGKNGKNVDYGDFYHFLTGLSQYDEWKSKVDYESLNRRLKHVPSPWCDKERITGEFEKLINHFSRSILVISYRLDGIPTVEELKDMLLRYYKNVDIFESQEIKYALSNTKTKEVLLVASNENRNKHPKIEHIANTCNS